MITIEKCRCGHRSCRDYWLNGIGKFVQGSGFTQDEAQRIADLLNTGKPRLTHRKLLKLAADYGVPLEGDIAFSQGYAPSLNPHEPNSVGAMRWISDWWRASAEAYDSHLHGQAEAAEEHR